MKKLILIKNDRTLYWGVNERQHHVRQHHVRQLLIKILRVRKERLHRRCGIFRWNQCCKDCLCLQRHLPIWDHMLKVARMMATWDIRLIPRQWMTFDILYPYFAKDFHNVWLGLDSDGFNPFQNMSVTRSTWPVILFPYKHPPWMCMKEPYFMLCLLFPCPSASGNNIDIYL